MSENTAPFSANMLRVIAAGIRDLHDGDLDDIAQADMVALEVLHATRAAGNTMVWDGNGFTPANLVGKGYVDVGGEGEGVYVWQGYHGEWSDGKGNEVPDGTPLYYDEACTIQVRNVEKGS